MLTKLLKYDLKYMIKNMAIFYILSLIFAICTRIFFSLKQTVIVNIIGQICVGCLFSVLFSILFNTVIRSWVRFKDSIYKDEAYLTHTLPVTKKEIYESRFIQTLIFIIVGFTVIIISLLIAYYTKERYLMVKNAINGLSVGLNVNTVFFIIMLALLLFLEIINAVQTGYFGIIIGYNKNNNKTLFSFIFGALGYVLSQSITLLIVFIVGLFNSSIMDLFTNNVLLDNSSIKLLLIMSSLSYLLVITIFNIINCKLFKKGVNIE